MGFTRFDYDYDGMGAYLRSSTDLSAAVKAHAQVGVDFARAIAPVGPPRDPHRGAFKASLHVEDDTGTDGRVGARIVGSPPWVEFGRPHTHPYRGAHILGVTRRYLNTAKGA